MDARTVFMPRIPALIIYRVEAADTIDHWDDLEEKGGKTFGGGPHADEGRRGFGIIRPAGCG